MKPKDSYQKTLKMVVAAQESTGLRETSTIAAIGNVFAVKKVKLVLPEMFNSDPSKLYAWLLVIEYYCS